MDIEIHKIPQLKISAALPSLERFPACKHILTFGKIVLISAVITTSATVLGAGIALVWF